MSASQTINVHIPQTQQKSKRLSLKGLKRCKDALTSLITETAGLAAGFDIFRKAADEFGVDIDGNSLTECREMLSAMNRLMYRQLSELKHRQMMQITGDIAARTVERNMAKYNYAR